MELAKRVGGRALIGVFIGLLVVIQAVFAIAAYAAPSQAAIMEDVSVEVDGITYTVELDTESKTACVADVSDPAAETTVTMPASIDHEGVAYTVTSLQWGFFSPDRDNVVGLVLPDTLTNVNGASFGKFPNVTELTIPGSVKVFDGDFQSMKKLTTLTFSEGVEEIASNSMVSRCESLTTVNLPKSLLRITQPATFSGAAALQNIALPDDLVVSEGGLFSGCASLTSVHLPATMTEIPSNTFSKCTSLVEVTAAAPVAAIGSSAFYECAALKAIPDLGRVTKIGEYAFEGCGELAGPVDLSSVAEMGSNAFHNCRKLSGDLDLSSLNVIPKYAFRYVSGITSIKFSDSLTSIGNQAFVWASVDQLHFPETLETIGSYAFYSSDELIGTVVIPDSVTSLGAHAFEGTGVERFEVGGGLEEVDASAFASDALKEIVFDNSRDNVSIAGSLPEGANVVYTQPSIDDSVGDAISSEPGAPTLQEAVDAAAQTGATVTVSKHVKLTQPVVVPAGKTVTVISGAASAAAKAADGATAGEAFQISGVKSGSDLKNLFVVEDGGSLVIEGKLVLSGRYNTGSVVLNHGAFELGGEAVVSGSKLLNDMANGTGSAGLGVVDSRGENAKFVMSGGKITENALNDSGMAYSGIVRVSDGARIEITGGEISNNRAVAANALSCSSGVLLQGDATGSMSGGVISGNSGHRGSAILLFGDDSANRTTFTLSDGAAIEENTCTSASKVQGSGAVHVEDNADFFMTGGSICDNKGVQGAGVCVVDGNLQNAQPEYRTGFVMDGGSIDGNSGSTGGGVYSYSNGTVLNAGSISGNTASRMGGGVYSEGNYDSYSTLHLSSALISGNTARLGGGMWFCATGETTVRVNEGAAIFDNTAVDSDAQRSAGDDFVFSSRPEDDYAATLANRMLGGGAVEWYEDGGVYLPAAGVYPSVSANMPRYDADVNAGDPVTVTDSRECWALKAVPFSEEVVALAKSEAALVISGNKADMGGGVGANGGIVAGDDATTQIKVSKVWKGDTEEGRPESVTVNLLSNGVAIDRAVLSADNGWAYEFKELPVADGQGEAFAYSVSEDAVSGYVSQISGDAAAGFVVTNTKSEDPGEPNPPTNPDGGDSDSSGEPGQGGSDQPGEFADDASGEKAGQVLASTGDRNGALAVLAAAAGCAGGIAVLAIRRRSEI